MAEYLKQKQPALLRAGYFNRDAFRQKGQMLLVLQTGIAGLQFHVDRNSDEGRELLQSLTPGTELKLFRDPNNDHDRWAIMVCTTEGKELGYITRYKNETIARLMDVGKVFHAYVDELPEDDEIEDDSRRYPTPTENLRIPFSVYMEE